MTQSNTALLGFVESYEDIYRAKGSIVASVSPPPELEVKPPLWEIKPAERARIAAGLGWPWGRA